MDEQVTILGQNNITPILPAYEYHRPDYNVVRSLVWCKWCGVLHKHGIDDGHRTAPCFSETPYSQTGYTLKFSGVVKSPCEARPGNAPMDGLPGKTIKNIPEIRLQIVEKWLSNYDHDFGVISGKLSEADGASINLETGNWHRWSYSSDDRGNKQLKGNSLAMMVESLYDISSEDFTKWFGLSLTGCNSKTPPEMFSSKPGVSSPSIFWNIVAVRQALLMAWLPDGVSSHGTIDFEFPDGGAVCISFITCHWIRWYSSIADCEVEKIEGDDLVSFAETIFGIPQELSVII